MKKNVAKNNPQKNQQKGVQKSSGQNKKRGSKKVNSKGNKKTGVRRTKSTESTFSIGNTQTQEPNFGSHLRAQFGPPQG
jgi:hypothetical protein